MFCLAFLLVFFSTDWAKSCKAVNYEFKQYGIKQYGYGCQKGCFGYANSTLVDGTKDNITGKGLRVEADHWKQDKCVECKSIDSSFIIAYVKAQLPIVPGFDFNVTINNTELEKACNGDGSFVQVSTPGSEPGDWPTGVSGSPTCFWKKGKCGAASCPNIVARSKCNGNWTDSKCVKFTSSDYKGTNFSPYGTDFPGDWWSGFYFSDADSNGSSCRSMLNNLTINQVDTYDKSSENYRWITCDDLSKYYHTVNRTFDENATCVKYTDDHVTECNYRQKNPYRVSFTGTYEYTKADRKFCHKVYGCLYASGENQTCSTWSVWAFALTLALLIVVVVGGIAAVLVVFLVVLKK